MLSNIARNVEWPGIATLVAIVLIACIAMDLSKWQPLMAALIALGGGALAYKGAMAKVALDEREQLRETLRKKLALYLKLELVVRRLLYIAQDLAFEIEQAEAFRTTIEAERLRVREPIEVAEAWEALDLFPRVAIRGIADLRRDFLAIGDLLDDPKSAAERSRGYWTDTQQLVGHRYASIVKDCEVILNGLHPEIESLVPDLSFDERHAASSGFQRS